MLLTLQKTRKESGGARSGSGRKAFDVEFEDRKIICMWLCDWFARKLGSAQRPATDAECELATNNSFPSTKIKFKTSKAQSGGMWAKARRGERPFSDERMKDVMFAAVKRKFCDKASRINDAENTKNCHATMALLTLIAEDGGLGHQNAEKQEFENLQANLHKSLHKLSSSDKRRASFERSKGAALEALTKLRSFLEKDEDASVDFCSGRISIKDDADLLASPYYDGESSSPDWILNPRKVIKKIAALKFGDSLTPVSIALGQTWAMQYETPIFSNSIAIVNHVKRLNADPSFKSHTWPDFNAHDHIELDSFIASNLNQSNV